ncbi:hypothetical protein SDC9_191307 [bioreactor metagenome]|uniref:Uncharacterized protein n=1 Tax=bioreactor metagenome TaxID=1076179 RepID=A0A645HXM6_9ZZZZ
MDSQELSDLKFRRHFDDVVFLDVLQKEFRGDFDGKEVRCIPYPSYNEKLTVKSFTHAYYDVYTEKCGE